MDTPNFIDFFHLEAGRNRQGKMAACKQGDMLVGRINPKKSYFYLSSFVFRAFNIDAQFKAFL